MIPSNLTYYIIIIITVAYFPVDCALFRFGRGYGGFLGSPPLYQKIDLPKERWFEQKLDHFTPSDLRTWKQRYFINDTFYDVKNPGPVFLMIGGEGPADPRWMVTGAWINYAKRFKALCVNLEHRFYGKSHPTPDVSVKNLAYLSSEQALADLANFISAMNDNYHFDEDVKWVAFGGSYPGSLAAWLRLKYPHLVHAAVSSSGPLLAKVDFMEYYKVVVDALNEKTGSDKCIHQVKVALGEISKMITEKPLLVESRFRLCQKLSEANGNDLKNLHNTLAGNFAGIVQYNEDNRLSVKEEYRNVTINTVCDILTDMRGMPVDNMAVFNSIILDMSNETCLDYNYKSMIKDLRNDSWEAEEVVGGARQWTYQTCTEFGFFQTSSAAADIFGNDFAVDFYIQQCKDIFGDKFNATLIERAVEWTNAVYGALEVAVRRVVFVHGSVDPWHALGITTTRDQHAPAIYIKGTAHCANMYPPRDDDPEQLKEARVEIEQYLSSWLEGITLS